jgi:hypothetical protein
MKRIGRREALWNGLLLVAAGLGVRAAAPAGNPAQSPDSFRLYGRGLTTLVSGRAHGQPAQRGDRVTVQGRLLAEPDGAPVGEFVAAAFTTRHPGPSETDSAGSLEMHTFRLPDGTLIGSGAVASRGTASTFAIVGGTGRYLGARGAYEAVLDTHAQGDEGTAEFIFTLVR